MNNTLLRIKTKTAAEKEWEKQEIQREVYRKVLRPHAQRIVEETCKSINATVPIHVDGMTYARQWVLEEAIRLLQARV